MTAEAPEPHRGSAFIRCRAWLDRLDAVTRRLVIAAMAAMTVLIVTQVFFRYVLGDSIDWAEEGARIAFIWAIFLAIPHGIRGGIHVGIDVVMRLLPPGWQEILFRLSAFLGLALMGVVFIFAWSVAASAWDTRLATIRVSSAIYYIAVLLAAGHSVLHLALLSWGGSTTWQEEKQP